MEIGPLSEWVTASAEVAAVIVALFLPYYEEHRKTKLRNRNLKLFLQKLVKDAMREPEKINNLESFLKFGYWIDYNSDDEIIFIIGNQILSELKSNQDNNTTEQKVKSLLKQLALEGD
ncbi:hypothetical protein DS832_05755 [Bombilactobacillus bombi]|uniref:Uncharacterized protein n=1 Tax=Bombilactobacillus bombi TaxID=1303590 RepID=A0A417Z782_9LACO|nr:hypothetical protein [Bombilactobacillus bombi]RHW46502.1 hypothetical protein DS832_05755 [Bombilactobacillus bombi]